MVQSETNIGNLKDNVAENRADSIERECKNKLGQQNTHTEQSDQEEKYERTLTGETYLGRDNSTVCYVQPLPSKTSVRRRQKYIVIHLPRSSRVGKQLWIRDVYFLPMI